MYINTYAGVSVCVCVVYLPLTNCQYLQKIILCHEDSHECDVCGSYYIGFNLYLLGVANV